MGSRLVRLFGDMRRSSVAACLGLALVCAGCTDRVTAECEKSVGDAKIAACTRMIETGDWKGADLAWTYIERGKAKYFKGDFDGAIVDHSQAIEADQKNVSAYTNRGHAKQRKGDLEGAIADSSRAIEIDPAYAPSYILRGLVKKDNDDFDGALADFDRFIMLDPQLA